jgi:hypothetical protein
VKNYPVSIGLRDAPTLIHLLKVNVAVLTMWEEEAINKQATKPKLEEKIGEKKTIMSRDDVKEVQSY